MRLRRQLTAPRLLVAAVAVALPAYVYAVAPSLAAPAEVAVRPAAVAPRPSPAPAPSPSSTRAPRRPPSGPTRPAAPPVFPARGHTFLGISLIDPGPDLAGAQRFARATGVRPAVVQFTRAWAGDRFDPSPWRRIAAQHAMPMLSWEPWDAALRTRAARELGDQPAFRLSRIVDGAYDPYIAGYALGVKALGFPVAIRFAHEMNGFWYPWGEQSNGNRPGDYVRAYRHVRDVFRALGVDDVVWVWSVNVTYPGSTSLARLYPGDDAVDWIGISGYYGIVSPEYVDWSTVFGPTFAQLRRIARKPIVITELGATDVLGRKADWVRSMYAGLARAPDVLGVIWFEAIKEEDWRLSTSPAAAAAFGAGARSARYRTRWTPSAVPRTWLGGH